MPVKAKSKKKATRSAQIPLSLIPDLSASVSGTYNIRIENVGQRDIHLPGTFTVAKALGIAVAEMTRGSGTYTGIACNVMDAFTLVVCDFEKRRIEASVRSEAPTMEQKVADTEFVESQNTEKLDDLMRDFVDGAEMRAYFRRWR